MAQKIDDIFNDCLERLFKGQSIEDCLRCYPQQASALEPLLRTSLVLLQGSAGIKPAPEFKARLHSQLQAKLQARKEKAERKAIIPIWRRGWAVAMACVLVVLLSGVGMVFASADALPEEPLYLVKLATEQARLSLAFSDQRKAELHIRFAERRATEMAEMARQGRQKEISILVGQIAAHLGKVSEVKAGARLAMEEPAVLVPQGSQGKGQEGLKNRVNMSRSRTLTLLRAALVEAPQEARSSLEEAIEEVARDYDRVLLNLES